jgi:hypothetical protein
MVHCNICRRFIKEIIKPSELGSLKGTEICTDCEKKTVELIDAMQKISVRVSKQITDIAGKTIAEMEELKRRVVAGDADGTKP